MLFQGVSDCFRLVRGMFSEIEEKHNTCIIILGEEWYPYLNNTRDLGFLTFREAIKLSYGTLVVRPGAWNNARRGHPETFLQIELINSRTFFLSFQNKPLKILAAQELVYNTWQSSQHLQQNYHLKLIFLSIIHCLHVQSNLLIKAVQEKDGTWSL